MGLGRGGLLARLSKARAMSPRELTDRLLYKGVLSVERVLHARGSLARPGRLRDALRSDLRGTDWRARLLSARRQTRARFLPSVHERIAMKAAFVSRPDELGRAVAAADAAAERRFEFFGGDYTYPEPIDWQADPPTGRRWPSVFHADVPVHGGDVGFGDVKHVWELSRQQYLVDLGRASFLCDDSRHVESIESLVRSWIVGNPYATGVNWACALEPAFRTWSWLWAYHLTTERLSDQFHFEWLEGFYDHARFISRHMELYSSPYNHLIGEASALFALGHVFPEFADARKWKASGRRVLEHRLDQQFYEDGGSVEQSTFYHHATLGFYLLAALVGQANGDELSRRVWAAIERGMEFSMRLMKPDGFTPAIGGADDGKPIRMEHLPFWDFRPYLAIGAVVFGRPDFKAASGRFYEDALWMVGSAGQAVYEAMPSTPSSETGIVLKHSGYAVFRSSWSETADYVCLDIGEQAAGMRPDSVPNSMHGHADCLSVLLSLGGRPVLIDSGLFAYNCGGEWERHFRETSAHNTIKIDGRDQARHIGKMAWSNSYRARIESHDGGDAPRWVIGSHDGYARGPLGVVHRRAAWLRPSGYLLVWDEIVGSGAHDLEVNYQFAPGELEAQEPGRVMFSGFAEVAWLGTDIWQSEVRCGGETPEDGWVCPSLGQRQPAPRLTLRARMDGGRTTLLTIFAKGAARRRITIVEGSLDGKSVSPIVAVVDGSSIDWVRAAFEHPGEDFQAPLSVYRVDETDTVRETSAAGGAAFRVDAGAFVGLRRLIAAI